MARIRTIKPEYWSSPDTASVDDPWARLLFIAMWNWADDSGRGTANPKELAGFAFPNDEWVSSADIRRMLGGIRRGFGVTFYKVGGRTYYAIPSWDTHQKIDKRSGPRHPPPEEGDKWDPDPDQPSDLPKQNNSAGPAEGPPTVRRMLGGSSALEVGSRNRGTGEQGGGWVGNSATGRTRASDEPAHGTTAPPAEQPHPITNPSLDPLQARCQRHNGVGDPPNCHACGQARREAEQAAEEHRRAQAAATSTAARERAALQRAEIDACPICDSDGYRFGQVCDHDPAKDERTRRGRALVTAALADRGTRPPPMPAPPSADPERKAAARAELDAARRTAEPEAEPS